MGEEARNGGGDRRNPVSKESREGESIGPGRQWLAEWEKAVLVATAARAARAGEGEEAALATGQLVRDFG